MRPSATLAIDRLPTSGERSDVMRVAERVKWRISLGMTVAHTIGALDLFVLMFWVLPTPRGIDSATFLEANLIALAIYLPLAVIVGKVVGARIAPTRFAWIKEDRPPTAQERDVALRMPLHCLRLNAGLWLGGLVLFTTLNLTIDPAVGDHVGTTILLGGLMTCAVAYLMAERMMQPITALALAAGPPARPAWPGVEGRIVLAWVAATGIPLLGLIIVGLHATLDASVSRDRGRSRGARTRRRRARDRARRDDVRGAHPRGAADRGPARARARAGR